MSIDDIVIRHEVNIDGQPRCSNLTIEAGGGLLTLVFEGDLELQGSLANAAVRFEGPDDKRLVMDPGVVLHRLAAGSCALVK